MCLSVYVCVCPKKELYTVFTDQHLKHGMGKGIKDSLFLNVYSFLICIDGCFVSQYVSAGLICSTCGDLKRAPDTLDLALEVAVNHYVGTENPV